MESGAAGSRFFDWVPFLATYGSGDLGLDDFKNGGLKVAAAARVHEAACSPQAMG
jgi:hypothetical protein